MSHCSVLLLPPKPIIYYECLFYSLKEGSILLICTLVNLVKLEISVNLSQCNVDLVRIKNWEKAPFYK